MVFSSLLFLTLFLPIVLTIYLLLPWRLKNLWLLIVSLFFYLWGEPYYGWVMLLLIFLNYIFGLWLQRSRSSARSIIALAVVVNLSLLIFFKYAHFFADILKVVGLNIKFEAIPLPIGISFFTFHALSYVIDVYHHESHVQKNPVDFGLYIAFFPQLIAGPIIRYHDIDTQLAHRKITREKFVYGIERFIIGLSKKVLIANVLAESANKIFDLSSDSLTPGLAWFGLICYALQIYFDFSGYSDMAIGLARMFGFKLLENFNYPYISRSITEFWHRWHISLSNWFRDYLYIPLGGNRKGKVRTYFNLVTVFFLCGLWHGASWNFIVWGLFYGAILVLERIGVTKFLTTRFNLIAHVYTLFLVLVAWVFFRTETLEQSFTFLQALFGLASASNQELALSGLLQPLTLISLALGILASTPLVAKIFKSALPLDTETVSQPSLISYIVLSFRPLCFICLMIFCAMRLAAGTFNPFIYFRF